MITKCMRSDAGTFFGPRGQDREVLYQFKTVLLFPLLSTCYLRVLLFATHCGLQGKHDGHVAKAIALGSRFISSIVNVGLALAWSSIATEVRRGSPRNTLACSAGRRLH